MTMVIVSPLIGVVLLPNGLNWLYMRVTNYLLTRQILHACVTENVWGPDFPPPFTFSFAGNEIFACKNCRGSFFPTFGFFSQQKNSMGHFTSPRKRTAGTWRSPKTEKEIHIPILHVSHKSPKTKLCPLVGSGILYTNHPKEQPLFPWSTGLLNRRGFPSYQER